MGATEHENSSEAMPCVPESEFEHASSVEAGPGPDRGSDSAPEEPSIVEDAPELPGDEPGLSRKPMTSLSAAEAWSGCVAASRSRTSGSSGWCSGGSSLCRSD